MLLLLCSLKVHAQKDCITVKTNHIACYYITSQGKYVYKYARDEKASFVMCTGIPYITMHRGSVHKEYKETSSMVDPDDGAFLTIVDDKDIATIKFDYEAQKVKLHDRNNSVYIYTFR